MKITPDKYKIHEVVNGARKAKYVLPEFQRNFVWPYSDVVDYLVSLLKGFYVGNLLIQDADENHSPFAWRQVMGTPVNEYDKRSIEAYILDGQQRITTLHYVMYAPDKGLKNTEYPYVFFLDLVKFEKGEVEDSVYGERKDYNKKFLDNPHLQYEKLTVPFTKLTQEGWEEWQDGYIDAAKDETEKVERVMRARKWDKLLRTFFNYEVSTMTLEKVRNEDAHGIEEVCAIFEKMNTKGVRLTVFDLLTARLYKDGIELRKLWAHAYENSPHLQKFTAGSPDDYGVLVLRAIAMKRGVEAKSSKIINLAPDNFVDDFNEMSRYMELGLKRVNSLHNYGVFNSKWFPYYPMSAVLAVALWYADANRLGNEAYKIIDKWYWASVFGERYQSAVESVSTKDSKMLMEAMRTNAVNLPNEYVSELSPDSIAAKLRRSARASGAVYRGVMCLLAINEAADFRLDDSIIAAENLDDHHIFPKNYLHKKGNYNDIDINSILNRTLITDRTNRKIINKAPSVYIQDENLVDISSIDRILRKHYIDDIAYGAMLDDNFDSFRAARSNSLVDAISNLLG